MSTQFTREAAQALAERLDEPGWLAERRFQAFDVFEKLDLPDPKGDEWRYTDVTKFDFSGFEPPEGRRGPIETPADLAARGVIFTDLRTAARDHPDLLKEHFFTEVPIDEHKFTALHGAFLSDGVFVYVPRGVEVEMPLEVLRDVAGGGSTFPHTTIVVDVQGSLTFVDRFKSEDADARAISSSVVEVEARAGATVNYISLQEWGRNVQHFQTQRFSGHHDATVRSVAVNLGSAFARTQVESVLRGEGSFSEMLGLYFADSDQHSQRTLQSHNMPHATLDLAASKAFEPDIPYVIAWVDLDEGPRMITNIVGCRVEDVKLGMKVSVVFEQASKDIWLPKFKPL